MKKKDIRNLAKDKYNLDTKEKYFANVIWKAGNDLGNVNNDENWNNLLDALEIEGIIPIELLGSKQVNPEKEIPDYIKIDVDGTEHLILDGAKNILASEDRPKEILIELHKEFEDQYSKVFNIMKKNNYELIDNYPDQIEYIFRIK